MPIRNLTKTHTPALLSTLAVLAMTAPMAAQAQQQVVNYSAAAPVTYYYQQPQQAAAYYQYQQQPVYQSYQQPTTYYSYYQQPAYQQAAYQQQAKAAAPKAATATAAPAATTAGDPYGFTSWLNSIRASYGLPAVGYDPNLSNWAAANNNQQQASGMGHHVMGPARRQNAAMGAYATIGSMWLNSPAHRSALLDPSIRWIGIAGLGAYWTFNAY